jgi:putative glutamine amidotransferase
MANGMKSPLIGITTYRTHNRFGYSQICVNEAYISSVMGAGGTPFLIPLGLSEERLLSLLLQIDGVLFSGGGDLNPESYGSQMHPRVDNVDPDRDRVELFLIRKVIEMQLPFFGICRGLQLVNVGLGGGLYEDITDQRPGSLQHQSPASWPRDRLVHPVVVEKSSKLYEILDQPELLVNSVHHQGVRELASGVRATAFAPDGIIEAFEIDDFPFGLAVQWHPEWLQAHPSMQALFRSFVDFAATRQEK